MSLGLTPAGQLRWSPCDGEPGIAGPEPPLRRGLARSPYMLAADRIDRMIAEKRQFADDLLDGGGEIDLTELSDDELIDLIRLDVTRANPQAEG